MKYFFKNSFPYVRKYMPVIVLSMLFGLFRIGILLVTPQVVALLVDRVINPLLGAEPKQTASIFLFLIENIPADDYARIFWVLAATLMFFSVLFFVCFYLKWNLAHSAALKAQKGMRKVALDKVNSASTPLINSFTSGDLVLITTSDPTRICDMYIHQAQFLLDNLLYVALSVVFLCRINPYLIILPLVGGIGSAVVVACFRKKVGEYFDQSWKDSSQLSTTVQESVYGVRTVASFAREEGRRELFDRDNTKRYDTNIRGLHIFAHRNLITSCIRSVVITGEIALGIFFGLRGEITAGEFTAMIGYVGTMLWQIMSFLFNINASQRNLVSGKRFFGFLQAKDEAAERYGSDVPSEKPSLELKGVGVKSGEEYALKNIDLSLPYGKKLGVMGRTGSGKTLLCKLIQGFAEADEGEILIDGKPIHDYDRNELLRAYSYAMQNVFLFSNTISANIALYDPFIDEETIMRCGKLAEVDEFARRFPEGYQTTVGEKGFGLSGGQKQRISIARALLKNASILVFDDVTSALDLDTEHRVFKNIEGECGDKTLILVTHRATALKNCDEILFLDRGEIVERGSFEELMAQNGNFAEIYNRQINEVTYEE